MQLWWLSGLSYISTACHGGASEKHWRKPKTPGDTSTCTGWQTDTCADHHQNLRTWLKVTPGSRKKNRQKMANTEGNKSRGREGCSSRFHHDNPPTERRIRGRKGSNRDWAVVWGAKKHGKGLYIPWFVYECGTPNCQVSPTSCKSSSVMYKMLNQAWE